MKDTRYKGFAISSTSISDGDNSGMKAVGIFPLLAIKVE